MEISFLKSLTNPVSDKIANSAPSGTLPAFPEGMLKEDTRSGSAPLQEEGRSGLSGSNANQDGMTVSGTGEQPVKPLVYNPPADKLDRSALQIPDIVLYPGAPPNNAADTPLGRPVVEPIILVPQTEDRNAVKLSDIDPESKIMPYGNGDADGMDSPDQLNASDPARQRPLPGPTVLPVQPNPASSNPVTGTAAAEAAERSETASARSPKLSIPINEMPAPEPAATERSQSVSSTIPAEAQPSGAGLNGAIANRSGVTETSSRRTVSSQGHEPDSGNVQEAAKPDPAAGISQTKPASGPVENISSQLASANAGKSRGEKTTAPITVEPDIIESEAEQKTVSSVAAFNPLAGWRPKQAVTGDGVSGLAIGPARATSAATGNAPVQNSSAPMASNAGEAVLEFDANFIDNLAREISNITQARGIARFALKPEHLGRIDVEIRGGEHGDDIKMTAETDTVRQFLVQSLSRLEQEVRLQGQKLTGVEIGTNLSQSQEQNARDTASSNGLKPGQASGSPDDPDAQQYSAGNSAGQTSTGTRYA